ncbi:MAG TPA: Uma2 family endonuclease [Gemmataceae bacterium]|nr:Uma2 family endonuclease [Gemmataceae bacterium]
MSTVQLKLGPTDHGRRLTLDDFDSAEFEPGAKYEIIDGRLYVSPVANFPEHFLEGWLRKKLERYSDDHPEVFNFVAVKSRVYVRNRRNATVPEPDIATFADVPTQGDIRAINWRDLNPLLVCEILVDADRRKDLERNPDLYRDVPSVREYWVLDGRDDANTPTLIQHRRYGRRWVVREFPFGTTFTTKLLPGFSLLIDPRK